MAELKFDITEEQVQEAVKAIVREEMSGMSEYASVYSFVKDSVATAIDELVMEKLAGRFDEIAEQAVEEHLSEPFTLEEGWGYNRTTYETYTDFIRAKLHEKFERDDYSVKREFVKRVQDKVDKAWEEYRKDAIATAMARVKAIKAVE